jgi:lipopolysaccharide/colanic/teichoic acid biosynthesis glycosyltransferase
MIKKKTAASLLAPPEGRAASRVEDSDSSIRFVEPHAISSAFWKRTLDLAVSALVLLIFFPIFLLIALMVRLTSKGPILYSGTRVGLSGRPFQMYKFRSMYVDADDRLKDLWEQNDNDGPCFKMKNDPRVTPVGRFLRRYSLDELPQFFNVFLGHMSLVGPRALHIYEVEKFDEYARERLAAKPGITCYWQIMGRSNLSFDQWMDLDHQYLRDCSLRTDLTILWRTVFAVVKGEGAY